MSLGPLTTAALAAGSLLRLGRNRCGTFTADLLPPATGGTEIGATMETPAAALDQLERALAAAYAPPPAGHRRAAPTPGHFRFTLA